MAFDVPAVSGRMVMFDVVKRASVAEGPKLSHPIGTLGA